MVPQASAAVGLLLFVCLYSFFLIKWMKITDAPWWRSNDFHWRSHTPANTEWLLLPPCRPTLVLLHVCTVACDLTLIFKVDFWFFGFLLSQHSLDSWPLPLYIHSEISGISSPRSDSVSQNRKWPPSPSTISVAVAPKWNVDYWILAVNLLAWKAI